LPDIDSDKTRQGNRLFARHFAGLPSQDVSVEQPWPAAQMGSANDIQSGERQRMPWNWSDFVIRRFDRSSSLVLPLNPRHRRADQAATG
jgi:hypothetical protein